MTSVFEFVRGVLGYGVMGTGFVGYWGFVALVNVIRFLKKFFTRFSGDEIKTKNDRSLFLRYTLTL